MYAGITDQDSYNYDTANWMALDVAAGLKKGGGQPPVNAGGGLSAEGSEAVDRIKGNKKNDLGLRGAWRKLIAKTPSM